MADTKKKNPTASSPKENTPVEGGKKKSKTIWYIVGGIILLLILIPVIGFFVVKGIVKKGVDTYEEKGFQYEQNEEALDDEEYESYQKDYEGSDIEEDEEEGETSDEEETKGTVDDELQKADNINTRFPEDIPLSGGVLTASSYKSDDRADVRIEVNSTVEEVLDWYENAFTELGWVVTERTSSDDGDGYVSGIIKVETEEADRDVRVGVNSNPHDNYTTIIITEWL